MLVMVLPKVGDRLIEVDIASQNVGYAEPRVGDISLEGCHSSPTQVQLMLVIPHQLLAVLCYRLLNYLKHPQLFL